jgi:hypothetical protein
MKIKKTEAVALLVALDFPKATTLSTKDLEHRIQQVPEKVAAEDVPKDQKDLYDQLVKAKGDIEVIEESSKDKDAKDEEPKGRKSRVDKVVDKLAADKKKAAAKEEKKPAKGAKKDKEGRKPREKKERTEVEKDKYGSVVGSDRAKINAAFPTDWASIEDIAEDAGVDVKKTKSRLRRARRQGHLEVRKIVEYRIKPGKK